MNSKKEVRARTSFGHHHQLPMLRVPSSMIMEDCPFLHWLVKSKVGAHTHTHTHTFTVREKKESGSLAQLSSEQPAAAAEAVLISDEREREGKKEIGGLNSAPSPAYYCAGVE